MRILIFGASITQGLYDTRGGWVGRLWEYYTQRYLAGEYPAGTSPTIFNLGVSGDSTKHVVARFEPEVKARRWPDEDFVFVFSIGTNNAAVKGKDQSLSEPEEYKQHLEKLIQQAKPYSNKILFVGLPACDESRTRPVSWLDITYTNQRLRLFDQTMQATSATHQLPYVSTFEITLDHPERLADGLHPNDTGHRLIADRVIPELDKLLTT